MEKELIAIEKECFGASPKVIRNHISMQKACLEKEQAKSKTFREESERALLKIDETTSKVDASRCLSVQCTAQVMHLRQSLVKAEMKLEKAKKKHEMKIAQLQTDKDRAAKISVEEKDHNEGISTRKKSLETLDTFLRSAVERHEALELAQSYASVDFSEDSSFSDKTSPNKTDYAAKTADKMDFVVTQDAASLDNGDDSPRSQGSNSSQENAGNCSVKQGLGIMGGWGSLFGFAGHVANGNWGCFNDRQQEEVSTDQEEEEVSTDRKCVYTSQHKKCSVESCPKFACIGGQCEEHGGTKTMRMCAVDGCDRKSQGSRFAHN